MTAILCRRTISGLSPDDDAARDVLRKVKVGDVVRVEVRRPRNLSAHRRFFALVNLVYTNSEKFPSPDVARRVLTCRAGHALPYIIESTGEVLLIPESISFANMDQDEFDAFWQRVVKVVCDEILPGVTEPEIEEEISRICEASTWQK